MHIGPSITPSSNKPFVDLVDIEFNPGGSANSVANPPDLTAGVPSIFNPYAIVVFPSLGPASSTSGSVNAYNSLIDGNNSRSGNRFSEGLTDRGVYRSSPSIATLVEDLELAKKTPYNYTDFLYCKYVGQIPNNQMITLRRYPAPTYDNLEVPATYKGNPKKTTPVVKTDIDTQDYFYPIAQAVTWFGEETGNKLSDIMSFTVNMKWKEIESEVNIVPGNEQGSEDSPAPGIAQFLGVLTGAVNTPWTTANSQYDPYSTGPYNHRVYGPVNVISKTFKRDRGLDFKQAISLNFEYSLKSIGSINPKAAMLDLMSNLLALTYNNAAFWGGANRYFPQKPTYPFLGGPNGMNAWYQGRPLDFAKNVGMQVKGGFAGIADSIAKLLSDPIGELKALASGAAKLGMIEMGKGKAPAMVTFKALLTGEPIGEWHMVVGNPYDPIEKIGNLICTEAKFQFNDIIGADNFPTELKVTITVEHGRPRDAGDIQSMFNKGQGRIYYPPKNFQDVLDSTSSTRNSMNDTSWKPGGGDKFSKSTETFGIFTGSSREFDSLSGSGRDMGNQVIQSARQAFKLADLMFLRTAGSTTKPTQ